MSYFLPLPPVKDLSGFNLKLHVFSTCLEVTQQDSVAKLITLHFLVSFSSKKPVIVFLKFCFFVFCTSKSRILDLYIYVLVLGFQIHTERKMSIITLLEYYKEPVHSWGNIKVLDIITDMFISRINQQHFP